MARAKKDVEVIEEVMETTKPKESPKSTSTIRVKALRSTVVSDVWLEEGDEYEGTMDTLALYIDFEYVEVMKG